MKKYCFGLSILLLTVHLAGPALAAAWAVPGAACAQEGANANSNGFLTCTSGVWVTNAVLLGTTSATCDSSNAGYIRYNGGSFEGCNGSGWVQLVGGSQLKVYQADGTTLVGTYVGTNGSASQTCVGLVYADASGNLSYLRPQDCSVQTVNDSAFFSGANCTGTAYIYYSANYVWACTGAETCQTNLSTISLPSLPNTSTLSYRDTLGVCRASSQTSTLYVAAPFVSRCGNTGPCLVK